MAGHGAAALAQGSREASPDCQAFGRVVCPVGHVTCRQSGLRPLRSSLVVAALAEAAIELAALEVSTVPDIVSVIAAVLEVLGCCGPC